MSLQPVQALVEEEMQAVNDLILQQIDAPVELIEQVSQHLIQSGGKRLRPMLVLLSAKCFDYKGHEHIPLAAIIEFFHTSSLLHDDVVDNSSLRRGKPTAHTIWGRKASVLVGDYIFSRAFEMMVNLNAQVLPVLAKASNVITQGEVEQLMYSRNPNLTEDSYMRIIGCKTATLFQTATEIGAIIASRPQHEIEAMAAYGRHLGHAFQMIDDALDYEADETLGKSIGNDLSEGKVTLPILHALQHAPIALQQQIRKAITDGCEDYSPIIDAIKSSDAIGYTKQCAEREIDKAITALFTVNESVYRNSLEQVALYNLERTF